MIDTKIQSHALFAAKDFPSLVEGKKGLDSESRATLLLGSPNR